MHNLGDTSSVLGAIKFEQIQAFLLRRGYRLTGTRPGIVSVFENLRREVVAVPLDASDSHYIRRIQDILDVFVDGETPLDDIVSSVVLPGFDVFRYRIQTPESAWGHVRLWYASEAMPALFNVLKFTAAGVYSQKLDYTQVGELPKTFVDQCRFGQTEYGSYVLKVYCPTNPIVARDIANPEPFGRSTTRALLENFAFLSSEKSQDPNEPLPPTMNRQVASAVANLNPQTTLGLSSEVILRYSELEIQDGLNDIQRETEPQKLHRIDLGLFVFSRAASLRDRLAKAEKFGREQLHGYITDLHKDRPSADGEQSHEITVLVKHGYRTRQVRLRLMPGDYTRAIRWHDDNIEIDLDAKIDKRGHIWTVAKLFALQPSKQKSSQSPLFPDTEGE